MSSRNLGIDAYANPGPDIDNADLLQNLEGCRVHRFSPGTGEHAGTALMVVELPTGEGLGVQIEMDTLNDRIPVVPCSKGDDGTWETNGVTEYREHASVEDNTFEVIEVTHHKIMDPDEARVLVILASNEHSPFAVDIYLHDDGGTDFFEVSL